MIINGYIDNNTPVHMTLRRSRPFQQQFLVLMSSGLPCLAVLDGLTSNQKGSGATSNSLIIFFNKGNFFATKVADSNM